MPRFVLVGIPAEFLADFIAKTNEELITQLVKGLRHFLAPPSTTARPCSLKTSL